VKELAMTNEEKLLRLQRNEWKFAMPLVPIMVMGLVFTVFSHVKHHLLYGQLLLYPLVPVTGFYNLKVRSLQKKIRKSL
jgi:hypothetical protein